METSVRAISRALAVAACLLVLLMGSGPVSGRTASQQAVFKQRHSITDLGTFTLPDEDHSGARGINDRGQVVGQSDTASGALHAFLWERGKMTDLGTLPGEDQGGAWDINDRGQAVGWGDRHALLWSKRGVHQPGRFSITGG